MATQSISMNIIKQVLIRLSQKESIRSIAAALHINKNTVSRYKALADADPMALRDLLMLEDTVLNHRFNGGNPAYCDHFLLSVSCTSKLTFPKSLFAISLFKSAAHYSETKSRPATMHYVYSV